MSEEERVSVRTHGSRPWSHEGGTTKQNAELIMIEETRNQLRELVIATKEQNEKLDALIRLLGGKQLAEVIDG